MKLSAKAQAKMNEMVDRFKQGDLSPIVKVAKTRLPEDAPANKWSFSNRIMSFAQTDDLDCRGYKQWKQVGRQVRKGEVGAFILYPRTVKKTNDGGEEYYQCVGFGTTCVFGYEQTDPIDEEDSPLTYEPQELPPLTEVAQALNIDLAWTVTSAGNLGWCTPDGSKIRVGTQDVKTFFHELAHGVHATIEDLKSGQDEFQETVAEFTASVLMELYDLGDRSGNAWDYISMYADDPIQAVIKASSMIGQVLDKITELAGEPG